MADGDPLAFAEVIDNFFKTYSEEVAVKKTIEQADTNPWAAVKVAEWCENNSYPNILSSEDKISFLEKAANCEWASFTEDCLHEEFQGAYISHAIMDAYIWSDPVGRAWYALGEYYLQFDDEKSLNHAYYYLTHAGMSRSQVREQLKLYRCKIRLLNKQPNTSWELFPEDREEEEEKIKKAREAEEEKTRKEEWERELYRHPAKLADKLSTSVDNIIFQEEYARKQLQKVSQYLEDEFGNSIWDKAASETKVYLTTGFYCFEQLKLINPDYLKMDFSVAINPVVKSLEEELSLRFYTRYLKYLKAHYPDPEDYFLANRIAPYDRKNRNVIAFSKQSDRYTYSVADSPGKFTLGSLVYVAGCGWNYKDTSANFDKTMLEYCKTDLLSLKNFCRMRGIIFSPGNDYQKEIANWLRELCQVVQSVKDIRNKASHGGQICSNLDCQYCYDAILLVKKILIQLLEVTQSEI